MSHHAAILGFLTLASCSAATIPPEPQPKAAKTAVAQVDVGPANAPEDRGLEVASGAASNAAGVPVTETPPECIDAVLNWQLGNCIAPSLSITDTCEKKLYSIVSNACMTPQVDTSQLVTTGEPIVTVLESDQRKKNAPRISASAIRGRLDLAVVSPNGLAPFDVVIELSRDGAPVRKHLVGVASRRH
ncbi:MAG: hypothetical protein HOW73_12315 [Polyangiaceae bacterium]|nr:hypothetical protein [Polyangiaceae bacterium]